MQRDLEILKARGLRLAYIIETHAHADHLDLLDAIGKRDAKRAARRMVAHLEDLERDLHLNSPALTPSLESIFGLQDRRGVTATRA